MRPPRVEFVSSMKDLGKAIDTRGTGGFGSTNVLEVTNPIEKASSRSISRRGRGRGSSRKPKVSSKIE